MKPKPWVSYFVYGVVITGIGVLTIIQESVSTRSGDVIPITKEASFFIGSVVILCGLWLLFFAVKNFLKEKK
ncbi:MAG: hypothetical protein HYU99_06860 [Deltaproteobacteria bacterium]|nr:hypothetical protein [Deltaproteobacteria bacterium]